LNSCDCTHELGASDPEESQQIDKSPVGPMVPAAWRNKLGLWRKDNVIRLAAGRGSAGAWPRPTLKRKKERAGGSLLQPFLAA
jgi:hypothetical protein